ncbi:hypothetical protein DENSPDRAFT_855593 [Dentipellis sp. KUC8613]|nr:hypothetical protein DENSPDRAFT_855593 [Dentipellis sp. KUC8613]
MDFPYDMTAWAVEPELQNVIVSAYSALIPAPPDPHIVPHIAEDGWWGVHEWTRFPQPFDVRFPYLAWISMARQSEYSFLHTNLTRDDVSTTGTLTDNKMLELRAEWDWSIQICERIFPEVRRCSQFGHVVLPNNAHSRLMGCYYQLESGLECWRDILETFRQAQRCLLELHAFVRWWTDTNRAADDRRSRSCNDAAYTRGCVTTSTEVYHTLSSYHVSVFLVVNPSKSSYMFASNRRVEIVSRARLSNTIPYPFDVHTKDLSFYPPYVNKAEEFEAAARGYAARSDILHPSAEYSRVLQRRQQQRVRLDKLAKQPARPSHPEIKDIHRMFQQSPRPSYLPAPAAVWDRTKLVVNPFVLTSTRAIRRYAYPPYAMLWAGQETRQGTAYLHFLLLRNDIQTRPTRGAEPLTYQEWKEILGHSYWKRCWPDPKSGIIYDPDKFWQFGGERLFGGVNAEVIAGTREVASKLDCGCTVTSSHAAELNLREQVVLKLSLWNIEDELKQMAARQIDLIGATDEISNTINRRVEGYVEEVNRRSYAAADWKGRRPWVFRLFRLLMTWKDFDQENFSTPVLLATRFGARLTRRRLYD